MGNIIFNNISSSDFDLILNTFNPQPPTPKVIKEEVPFMNGSYDFSNIYGEQSYDERKITCKLQIIENNRTKLYIKYSQILEWLLGSGKAILKYSSEPGLYYMAKVESAPSWDTFSIAGVLDFNFIAYPFKYGVNLEGSDIWDDFNFETDYAQEVEFDVSITKDIEIYNPSAIKITPTIVCDAEFDVIKNGITYKFNAGTTKDWRFNLDRGLNNLTLNGNGNIKFEFRKEVL